MTNFFYFTGTHVSFGEGALKNLAEKLSLAGIMKPCIVTDKFLIEQTFTKEIIKNLKNAVVYSGVVPNPTIASVDECAEFYRVNKCDGFIALGGGSAMDTVKGAAITAVTGKSVEMYLDGKGSDREPIPNNIPPFIAIPTTSGTGSEVSQYAVITDQRTCRKDSISSEKMYPLYAVIDPEVTYGLPKEITISAGLDVLGHALEAITSMIDNPMTDILALEAIKKVFLYLPEAVKANTHCSRREMSFASMIAGVAMSHCCGTLPHGLGCPLSGHCSVPHGLAVGVLQIPTIKLIAQTSHKQLERIAKYIDHDFTPQNDSSAGEYLIAKIRKLFDDVGRKADLTEFDITPEQIEAMVPDAMMHGCTGLMPVKVDAQTVRRIYRELAKGV